MTDDLERDYAGVGFGGEMGFGDRSALVVVDFVRAYLDPASSLYAGVESAVEPPRQVLEGHARPGRQWCLRSSGPRWRRP